MKNIFLAPRADETSHENFTSTILGGRPYTLFEPYLDESEKQILSAYPQISVWGNKESLKGRWDKMKPGDYVLFYRTGGFYYSARVILTKFNTELAQILWPLSENGKPWPCLFFVDRLKEIKIPIETVKKLAHYKESWDRVQGFMRLNDRGIEAIIKEYGTLEKFIGQESVSDVDPEEVVEGEVSEYRIPDSEALLRDLRSYENTKDAYVIKNGPRKVRVESKSQKRKVAESEGYRCQICDWHVEYKNTKGQMIGRIDVDHIIDKALGGTEEVHNLWALCPNCHVKKTLKVITVDLDKKKVFENGREIELHHDSHLNWN